jgi:hypothetical protein
MQTFAANEAMRAFYANRLQHRLNEAAQAAQQAGMTPEILDALWLISGAQDLC